MAPNGGVKCLCTCYDRNQCHSNLNLGAGCRAGFVKTAGGLTPVDCPGVQNVNLSNLVNGHFDYVQKIDEIMEVIAVNFV